LGDTTDCPLRTALGILADLEWIVNVCGTTKEELKTVELRSTDS